MTGLMDAGTLELVELDMRLDFEPELPCEGKRHGANHPHAPHDSGPARWVVTYPCGVQRLMCDRWVAAARTHFWVIDDETCGTDHWAAEMTFEPIATCRNMREESE